MCSASRWLAALTAALVVAPAIPARAGRRAELRVCADPNNLPFSNQRGEGFENRLAELVARDLHRTVRYLWFPQRRGFIRNTLKARRCDLVIGVPAGFEMARATRPYYRSSYVFVTRRDRHLAIRSLDDPILRRLRIGIHVIGDDYANVPPAEALARRGIVGNLVGYSIYGDYSRPDPPRELIDAVARGDIDVAIAWGPLAGYHAARAGAALEVAAVSPAADAGGLRFQFDIAMGVRRGDDALRAQVDRVIARRRRAIERILDRYGVPRLPVSPAGEREDSR